MRRNDLSRVRIVAPLAAALLAASAPCASAFQPTALTFDIDGFTAFGKASLVAGGTGTPDTRVKLLAANAFAGVDLLLELPPCTHEPVGEGALVASLDDIGRLGKAGATPFRPEPRWQACVRTRSKIPGLFLLRRGEARMLRVAVDFRAAGTYRVGLVARAYALPDGAVDGIRRRPRATQLAELLRHGALAAEEAVALLYEVTGDGASGRYAVLPQDDIPLPREEQDGLGAERIPAGDIPVAIDDYLSNRPLVPEMPYDPTHADLRAVTTETSPQPGQCDCIDPETGAACPPSAPARAPRVSAPPGAAGAHGTRASLLILGSWSVRWSNGLYSPGWGWEVVAWWDNAGTWVKLATTFVSSDGSFAMVPNHPDWTGQNLRVQFRPANPLFRVVNADQSLYRWNVPDFFNVPLGTPFDVGDWSIDASALGVNGIGELYNDGYQLWREMVFRAGINPQRADPIRVLFPNTTFDCGRTDNVPWSCANPDGRIWLILMHATNRRTIQHELGHQMEAEFWDGRQPAGCCIQHATDQCYNRGLAIQEGYANFVVFWAQFDRGAVPGLAGSFAVENPGGACKSPGVSNESWVAATLWDLHDSAADGDDTIYFTKQGATHAIYFNNPPPSNGAAYGLDDLRTAYRNQVSAGHETIVDAIFAQNDTN